MPRTAVCDRARGKHACVYMSPRGHFSQGGTMRRRTVLLALAALGSALAAGGALSATTSVTFTSPKGSLTIARHLRPSLTVAGKVVFASTTAGTSRLYLRRDGCGTSADNP